MWARGIVTMLLSAAALAPGAVAHALATPTLDTSAWGASGDGRVNRPIHDYLQLLGGNDPTGTIEFSLFPSSDPSCAGVPLDVSTVPVTSEDWYTSADSFPQQVGTYTYVARYSGDAQNAPTSTSCDDPRQRILVKETASQLATDAGPSIPVGGTLFDKALLTNVYWPSGAIAFSLYGPDDEACSRPPVFVSNVPLPTFQGPALEAQVSSRPYIVRVPGVYRWIAAYDGGGGGSNLPVAGRCGDPGETVAVTAPSTPPPRLNLRRSRPATVGDDVVATADVELFGIALGTLRFRLYGPNDDACARDAVAASAHAVVGSGPYSSKAFAPEAPGTYRVVASYDGGDGTTATTSCEDPLAAVAVSPAPHPTPVLEQSITVARVGGSVFVQVPGRAAGAGAGASAHASAIGFVELRGERNVPVGTIVDTRTGTARLTSATTTRALQSGVFRGSRFVVRQRRAGRGLVNLELRTADRHRDCSRQSARGTAITAKRRQLDKKVLDQLRAKVRGRFQTDGKHSSASAHGTEWLLIERCDGTLTRVITGAVDVRDFSLRRTVVVRAGDSYLARPERGRSQNDSDHR
jgi:hypothetical protein